MLRMLAALLLLTGFALSAPAQDAESESSETEQAESATEASDESDLDDESYADAEDDDFRPTEDIPADQSIPFPTDI